MYVRQITTEADVLILAYTQQNGIKEKDKTVTGFNIGMNCGQAAGQTVMHAHIHLIPRRTWDVDDPKGGVRGVIPGKMKYQ